MKKLLFLLILLHPPFSGCQRAQAAPLLQKAEISFKTVCKEIYTSKAFPFFYDGCSTCTWGGAKFAAIQSFDLDANGSTSTVRISTWAATADTWVGGAGYPLIGYAQPLILPIGGNIPLYARRGTGSSDGHWLCVTAFD